MIPTGADFFERYMERYTAGICDVAAGTKNFEDFRLEMQRFSDDLKREAEDDFWWRGHLSEFGAGALNESAG